MPETVGSKPKISRRLKLTLYAILGVLAVPIFAGMILALLNPETWAEPAPTEPRVRPAPAAIASNQHHEATAPAATITVDAASMPILNVDISAPDVGATERLHRSAVKLAELIARMNRGAYPNATHINVEVSPGADGAPHLAHTTLVVPEAKQHVHMGGSPDGLLGIGRETGFHGSPLNERAARPYCTAHPEAAALCEN